jgi:hypothetical protein
MVCCRSALQRAARALGLPVEDLSVF